jgi:arabinogalactan endo-1,4-beta-galactosidase
MEKRFDSISPKFSAFSRRRFLTRTLTSTATVAGLAAFANAQPAFAASLAQPLASGQLAALVPGRCAVLGHDISTLQQEESAGKTYSDNGRVLPLERILVNHGTTYIRERLWVNPPWPFNDLPHILAMARRARAVGLKFLLDIHYSDFWADPSKQNIPAKWQGQSLEELTTTVYNYTKQVVSSLVLQGTPPDMVQTGNEITNGMLWPIGQIYVNGTENWAGFTTLLKSAIAAVRVASPRTRVMVHIDRGGDNGGAEYFYDHILAQGVNFDVIGLSYYPFWHGPLTDLQANLNALAPRYNKDIVVAETAWPWTFANGDSLANIVTSSTTLNAPYAATPAGQLGYMHALLSIINQVPNNRGVGVFYWEPAWIPGVGWEPGVGDAWDNMTLFDFNGRTLPSVALYQ